jgi:hypothetical protein
MLLLLLVISRRRPAFLRRDFFFKCYTFSLLCSCCVHLNTIYLPCPPRLHYYYYCSVCVCVSVLCLHQLMTFYVWGFILSCARRCWTAWVFIFQKPSQENAMQRVAPCLSCNIFACHFFQRGGGSYRFGLLLYCLGNGEQLVSILLCFPTQFIDLSSLFWNFHNLQQWRADHLSNLMSFLWTFFFNPQSAVSWFWYHLLSFFLKW